MEAVAHMTQAENRDVGIVLLSFELGKNGLGVKARSQKKCKKEKRLSASAEDARERQAFVCRAVKTIHHTPDKSKKKTINTSYGQYQPMSIGVS